MKKRDDNRIIPVHNDPDFFREAINFTAAETLFTPGLIEKDYFCTLLLEYLASINDTPIFKGGTCLAKVHAGFYRLSEDLDFVVSMSTEASRSERSKRAAAVKEAVASLPAKVDSFRLIQPLIGANNSTQYIAIAGYMSLLSKQEESIKIEVGLREPLCEPAMEGPAKTILLNPVSGKDMMRPLQLPCISFREAMAEKFRAALSRREIAIRDFYDIDHAVRVLGFNPLDSTFIELVKEKLAIPGNDPLDLSDARTSLLGRQLDSQLRPVLRQKDFVSFDLQRALKIMTRIAAKLGNRV